MSSLYSVVAQALAEVANEMAEDGSRLAKGRKLYRKGAVVDISVADGEVTAMVHGTRPEPYVVSMATRPAAPHVGEAIDTSTPERGLENAIDDVEGGGDRVVPSPIDIGFSCSCPDWGDPCKHGIALVMAFAEHIDDEPRDLLTWRGVDYSERNDPKVVRAVERMRSFTPSEPLAKVIPLRPVTDLTTLTEPDPLDDFLTGGVPADGPLLGQLANLDERPNPFLRVRLPYDGINAAPVFADALKALQESLGHH